MKVILILILSFVGELVLASQLPDMHFDFHYNRLSQKRHPFYKNGEPWREGRKYVKAQFQKFGLRNITEQTFETKVSDVSVEGVNIIGLLEGSNKHGPIMIVGADYDTSLIANQNKDNTGGVASLLEVIHLFVDRIYWNPNHLNYTVIFVAFDLNTKEYHNSGMDKPGSYFFIHNWFLPYMESLGRRGEFRGAVILDSITTYNMNEGSQQLKTGFKEALPTAYDDITATGNKGDFLGLLYNSAQKNNSIISTFSSNFKKEVHKSVPFRLQEMEVTFSLHALREDVIEMMNHQSHYYFWTNFENPLPAFLLFDTDGDREDPDPICRLNCTVEEFLSEDRIQFMERTTTALWQTLIDLQTTKYDIDSATHGAPTVFLIFITAIISLLITK